MCYCLFNADLTIEARVKGFRKAIQSILDDLYKLNPASPAAEARSVAESLLKWSLNEGNKEKMHEFVRFLFNQLEKPFIASVKKSCNREKLWRNYFLLRSSQEFVKLWTEFLKYADLVPSPFFYQRLTDIVFREMIQDHFIFSNCADTDVMTPVSQEGSALRYAAGYVCRHLRKKLERESHELKEELILCLMALVKDRNSEECGTDEEWTKMMDRGGLWHVKETTYAVFLSIEEEIRDCLKTLVTHTPKSKCEILKKVTNSEDVQFYWLITTADFEIDDVETHETLLQMIVELYLTVRGYSYASVWMEKYKQATKKSIQRSKSLRRDLYEKT